MQEIFEGLSFGRDCVPIEAVSGLRDSIVDTSKSYIALLQADDMIFEDISAKKSIDAINKNMIKQLKFFLLTA